MSLIYKKEFKSVGYKIISGNEKGKIAQIKQVVLPQTINGLEGKEKEEDFLKNVIVKMECEDGEVLTIVSNCEVEIIDEK